MPKEREPRSINIKISGDKPVDIDVNGMKIHIERSDEKPAKEESPDDIVDWEATPSGDRPITRREKDDKDWDLYCRSSR